MSVPGKKEVTIVLAGKSGAGKSALLQNLLGNEPKKQISAIPTTKEVQVITTTRSGWTIRFVDTPYLKEKFESSSEHLQEFDLLILCVPVSPGSKFHDDNAKLMRTLQDTYSESVWKSCIVVFTFSDLALDHSENSTIYINGIEQYLRAFQEELTQMANGISSKSIFSSTQHLEENQILAIPAGLGPEDQILPGVSHHEEEGWVDVIFNEVLRKCGSNRNRGKIRAKKDTWWWCTIL